MLAGTTLPGADRGRPGCANGRSGPSVPAWRCSGGNGVHLFGIDGTQGVVAAPSQLAGHRDGGELAVVAALDRRVVVVVRAGVAGRVLGRLVERPPQRLGSL